MSNTNTEQKQKILLKRTTDASKESIPSGASHGELFLNIASGANAHNKIATMQIGTNNPIIWSDDVANEKKFALKTEVEALVKEVEDNELVTATAISTMNASAGFNEDGSSVLEGGMTLSEAIIDLRENGTKGNSYVWLLPEFPYGENIALTDEELENFKKYNMVAFKSIIPTDETLTKVCEQYYDGVKTYSDDETIKFVSFYMPPQRLGDEPNSYKWQLVTFNVNISITDKTISYYPEGYDVGELSERAHSATTAVSATTSISATTAVSAKTSVSATTSVSAKTSVNALSASTSVSAKTSVSATTSTKAIQDGDGNVITATYSTKDELSGAVNDIIEEIIDNELVTATAISTMNASAGFNEDGTSALPNGASLTKYIEDIHELVNDFNGDISALYGQKVDKTTTVNGQALSGNVTITKVNSASTADKAYQDGNGNNIINTYATKSSVVQSDWLETGSTMPAYIKNKPTISGSTILGVSGNTVMIQNVESTSPSTVTIGDDTILKSKSNNSNTVLTRSITSAMCLDTTVPDTYLKLADGTKWGSGYNNAILTISRYNTDKYSSQLGFSQGGIYYRGFGGTLPTTDASWVKVLLSNDNISATTSLVKSNDSQGNKLYLVGATTAGADDYKQLYNDSRIYTSGGCLFATSDERLKDFYEDVDCDLEALKNIPKKYFSWKSDDGKGRQVGTSAQELRKLYPEIVSVDDDGTHSVAYDRLSIVALSAIDKLYDTIKELQIKNEELEKRIKYLENK